MRSKDAQKLHTVILFVCGSPPTPQKPVYFFRNLSRHIKIHFAHRQIQVTFTNMIPLDKHKRTSASFVCPGAWLLQELLQVLFLLVILLATCMECATTQLISAQSLWQFSNITE